MENLFVYGTLRCPSCRDSVVGRRVPAEVDALKGYSRSKIKLGKALFPIIYPEREGSVKGLVITVTSDELKRIDAYETSAYKRSEVALASGKRAWVYHG
jgi:gamma-glutamylcyclotransferase (GGCT)/AIG2-like uncharacterized protein YtfP